MTPPPATIRAMLRDLFDTAVQSADPRAVLRDALPDKPRGRCIVVGAGKASAAMAAALEDAWPDVDMQGVVVTRYGHAVPTRRIRIIEAAHPVADAASEQAAHDILQAVRGLTADDCVIALISGGGSALLTLPREGLTLADKQLVNKQLLHSGATIGEMNVIRKHLSTIKGGRLAQAAQPARVITLLISDVPGDAPQDIASGPTVADESSVDDVRAILDKYRLELLPHIRETLLAPRPPVHAADIHPDVRFVASPAQALQAVARAARERYRLNTLILGDALEGESAQLGIITAGIARSVRQYGEPHPAPLLLISGGETTVTISSGKPGKGGRNTEYLLSLAIALRGLDNVWAIAGDSDGIDGTEDAAGAIITPDTLPRGSARGMAAAAYLQAHDSYSYFAALDDLVKTGPTLTNVNDIRLVAVL